MRMLVLGAGGTGGYFGGRLAQAGADVTFLVRPARARELASDGLVIRSPLGDASFPVRHVVADDVAAQAPFDVVLLACKAYDLDSAMDAIAPAMGPDTVILPILNGLAHYPVLDQRFGADRVLGGLCIISATKGPAGEVLHLGPPASITFGERQPGKQKDHCEAIATFCREASLEHTHAADIDGAIWTKFTFLTALASGTCLFRASVGGIVATDEGRDFMDGLYGECLAVAKAAGHPVPESAQKMALHAITQPGSPLTSSMLRDLLAGQHTEGAHIVGDMLHRARAAGVAAPHLSAAWIHLQAYEATR
ncbi:2-dehydropantoate 2-reductase [Luteibacter sp. Sphag1AF]|uniref:2-dehydropantoate 2-reductase n=1 Tax=Luteibacter sp. Sphag1AF TaxID=2587031 RepID=UPI0016174EA5|nr:2-dehydropantoate 2-reductase [Luteibacter sp. Sphag1AF]MBB3226895.1 2-dehydropantoate 2-reductase [Luteibacter sp. Sphag1AF]